MQIAVIVERAKGSGFRARGTEPLGLSAKGSTREEALANLRSKIEARLTEGTELVAMNVGEKVSPWMPFAGMFKDDPLMGEWLESMAAFREQVELDPNR